MSIALYAAAVLALILAAVHTLLGERYIIVRLLRGGGIPRLFGGTEFTMRTLRFAWHLTSIAMCGFAALLVELAQRAISSAIVATILAVTFATSAAMALVVSRGRHPAWLVMLVIGGIAAMAATRG